MYNPLAFVYEFWNRPWFAGQAYGAEEMVRDRISLPLWYLICDYGKTLVHLHSVAIDDLAIEACRKLNCKLPAAVSLCLLGP